MDIDTEGYERNIVREILRECCSLKITPNQNFVTFYLKLLLLDPHWGIRADTKVSRENVQELVKYVVGVIQDLMRKPKMLTLKMQFYHMCSMDTLQKSIERHRLQLKLRLSKLERNILAVIKSELSNNDEVEFVYRKITFYITLLAGLGNPEEELVYEEALKALKSILTVEELREFADQSYVGKEQLLEDYCRIVAGIRLFNKNCEKGGEGIEDLPDLLEKAILALKEELQNAIIFVMDVVNLLTTLIDKCYVVIETEGGGYKFDYRPTEACGINACLNITRAKDLLILYRQYELIMRKMMDEFNMVQNKAKVIFDDIENKLKKIHKTVLSKIAIPVGIVFPLFADLAETWRDLQDQVFVLARLHEVLCNLNLFSSDADYCKEYFEHAMGDHCKVLTDAERLEETANCRLRIEENDDVTLINFEDFNLNIDTQLKYHGFCPFKLVETNGALIPGNSNMGIIRYQNMNFVFSSPEAGEVFAKNPFQIVMGVLTLARRKPQLIEFLGLREDLKKVSDIETLVEEQKEVILQKNVGTETDSLLLDPDEEDKTYRWNIWQYKREALMWADVSSKITKSTQTDKSYSKNSMRVQTYYPKTTAQQTKKDNYTNVPKPGVFIYGLRGRKDDKQFKIHLTQPVHKY